MTTDPEVATAYFAIHWISAIFIANVGRARSQHGLARTSFELVSPPIGSYF